MVGIGSLASVENSSVTRSSTLYMRSRSHMKGDNDSIGWFVRSTEEIAEILNPSSIDVADINNVT